MAPRDMARFVDNSEKKGKRKRKAFYEYHIEFNLLQDVSHLEHSKDRYAVQGGCENYPSCPARRTGVEILSNWCQKVILEDKQKSQ